MNADADDIDAFEVDVHLYAVTLNRLANMVKWAMRHANAQRDHGLAGRIGQAMKDFERAAPDYKEIRDIHEHIEEYEVGKGMLQPPETPPGLTRSYSTDEVNVLGLRLDVNTSADAAALLTQKVESALGPTASM